MQPLGKVALAGNPPHCLEPGVPVYSPGRTSDDPLTWPAGPKASFPQSVTKGGSLMKALSVVLSLVAVMALALAVNAEEKGKAKGKEVTLNGTVTCAKCDLKESDSCHTVIKVKEEGEDVVDWL